MNTGIYENIPMEEYRNLPGISKHGLDDIRKSPALFQWNQANPKKPTDAMIRGTRLHTAVLEPIRFLNESVVAPEINRRTNAGKTEWQSFCEENTGKDILTKEEYQEISDMAESVFAHPAARKALSVGKDPAPHKIESSMFWDIELDGNPIRCKARPDLLHANGVVVDLKTTQDASPAGFAKSCANFRYHVQAAFYLDGFQKCTGDVNKRTFCFIAVETTPPYLVAVYVANYEMILQGEREFSQDLRKYSTCLHENKWEGYSQKIETITLPKWSLDEDLRNT